MNEPNISNIRVMCESDIDSVLVIELASFHTPWHREHFQQEIAAQHSFPFVLEKGGIIAGYVCLMSLFEEAQILNIAVAPEQRGTGIAKQLMYYAIKVAIQKKAEILALEVRVSNLAAIKLYERCGFLRTGIRQKYYEARDDALLMEKVLE